MPEQLDQADSFFLWDFIAGDENDAAGQQVTNLRKGLYSYPPVGVAIGGLRIPGLLAGKAPTAEEAGTAPDATACLLRAGIAA